MLACSTPCCVCSGKSLENTTTRNLKFPPKSPSPETPCANVLSLRRYTHRICAKFAQPVCIDLHMEFDKSSARVKKMLCKWVVPKRGTLGMRILHKLFKHGREDIVLGALCSNGTCAKFVGTSGSGLYYPSSVYQLKHISYFLTDTFL